MLPTKVQLNLYLDETFSHRFTYKDSGGTPIDISGCTGRMEVRSVLNDDHLYLILTTANAMILITDGPLGIVDIKIPAGNLDEGVILWGEGNYDLKLTFPDTTVDTIAYGKMVVKRGVTRG